jgi:hypothetical protein
MARLTHQLNQHRRRYEESVSQFFNLIFFPLFSPHGITLVFTIISMVQEKILNQTKKILSHINF